jgi:hypothetical protein
VIPNSRPENQNSKASQNLKTSAPEEQGVATAELMEAIENIPTAYPDIYSLLIVKKGHLILENYYKKGTKTRLKSGSKNLFIASISFRSIYPILNRKAKKPA